MKKLWRHLFVVTLILVLVVVILGLLYYRHIIYDRPTIWYPTIKVFQNRNGYEVVFFRSGNHLEGSMFFSADGQLLWDWKTKAINCEDAANFVGKSLEEISEQYGPPYADIGSGLELPTYVSKNANLIILYENDHAVFRVAVLDLLTFSLVEEYE